MSNFRGKRAELSLYDDAMNKCKDCQNYMCKDLGSYFLRNMYIEKCKLSGYRLFMPPSKNKGDDEI